ncbi:hypothetical protein M5689_009668 [Euphorbia peplus]|nr:hypothetical protein M5689_009668 [Euphorbia peplus]
MAQPSNNPVPAMTNVPIPLERPVVVVGQQYLTQYPVDLVVSTKIFTFGENDFSIKDVNGTLIFKIKSKLMSIHDRRFLRDAGGNTLVNLRQKIMTAHRRWEAYRGESKEEKDLLFSVKKSSMFQFRTQLDVFLAGNKSEQVPDFKIKGGWAESSCTIFLGDGESKSVIAQMHRGHNLATAFLDTENFVVTTYPNVDYAFVMALVVVLDEINNDRSGVD